MSHTTTLKVFVMIVDNGSVDHLLLVLAHDGSIQVEKFESHKPTRLGFKRLRGKSDIEFDVAVANATIPTRSGRHKVGEGMQNGRSDDRRWIEDS